MCARSVSYTHLDVYKRQILIQTLRESIVQALPGMLQLKGNMILVDRRQEAPYIQTINLLVLQNIM